MTPTVQDMSDRAEITDTCIPVAWLADRRDWPALTEVFDDQVELDYSSLTGADLARLSPQQVVDGWAAGLGGTADWATGNQQVMTLASAP